jgi:CBS domain-containing protein
MAEHDVRDCTDEASRREATTALLADIDALELILSRGLIERGVCRIGAEQEMFLVDGTMRPASIAMPMLAALSDARFTTELARFNLEANLPPVVWGPAALRGVEHTLRSLVRKADRIARRQRARVLLTGILPTIAVSDLTLDNFSPDPRYRTLNDTLLALRGEPFHVRIDGLDRFELRHENVLFEACNTSFQLHLQVEQEEFVPLYNLAQAISAPLLAAATNSPVLLGHRLWAETRIALFEHATDDAHPSRRHPPRVRFGDAWVERSIVDMFHEDAARFPVILAPPEREDPHALLARGEAPRLRALCAHNGTVWRWNRACYGLTDGVPHLRIENRILPAGPTLLDEVANAALFYGLMFALPRAYGRIEERLRFEDAKRNFFSCAREGLLAQLTWIDGALVPVRTLLLEELIPLARRGLTDRGLDEGDIDRYLGVVESRVREAKTGADWTSAAFATLDEHGTREARERAVVSGMLQRQHGSVPVHRWSPLPLEALYGDPFAEATLERVMTTDVVTVRPEDPIALARSVMEWEHIHQVAVEDTSGNALGLVSRDQLHEVMEPTLAVRDVMDTAAPTAEPELLLSAALERLASSNGRALLVVREGALIGIASKHDLERAAGRAA